MFWQRFKQILIYSFIGIVVLLALLIALAFIYQDRLKAAAINQINQQLKGELILKGEISFSFIKHFPDASVTFHQIILKDKNVKHLAFIQADEFDAGFNTLKIFRGEYVISAIYFKNTAINIIKYANGSTNYDVFKTSTNTANSGTSFKVSQLNIENSTLFIEDKITKSVVDIALQKFEGDGEYVHDNLNIDFDVAASITNKSKSLPPFIFDKPILVVGKSKMDFANSNYNLLNTNLTIAENEFEISGNYEVDKLLKLDFKGKNFDVKNLTQLLADDLKNRLEGTEGKDLLDNFNGTIENNYVTNQFSITGGFACENGNLHIAKWNDDFEKINCEAKFSFKNQLLNFELLKFNCAQNDLPLSISANYKMNNKEQFIHTIINGNLNLKNINSIYPIAQIETINGNLKFDSTQLNLKINGNNNLNEISIQNKISIDELELKTKNGYAIQNLKVAINADELGNLMIENGNGNINGNDMLFSGKTSYKNFLQAEKQITVIKLTAEKLDINSLLVANTTSKNDSAFTNNWIDFPLAISIDCKATNWNKFNMQNTSATINIGGNKIEIEKFTTETQNGNLQLNGQLIQSEKTISFVFNADYKNLNLTSTFQQFDNFNQTMLKAENVNGSLSGTTIVTGKFDKDFHVIPKSISSSSDLSMTNGELKNVTQLLSLSKYLKVDDLKNLKFATIKNQIEISDGKIIIPEMRIQNNALNINVSGTHTFDNEMDYLFKINLMDWFGKKLGKSADDDWENDKDKKGFNIFLRMIGKAGDIKILRDKKSSRELFKENLKAEHETMKALIKAELKGEAKKETPIDFKPQEQVELINWDDTTK